MIYIFFANAEVAFDVADVADDAADDTDDDAADDIFDKDDLMYLYPINPPTKITIKLYFQIIIHCVLFAHHQTILRPNNLNFLIHLILYLIYLFRCLI